MLGWTPEAGAEEIEQEGSFVAVLCYRVGSLSNTSTVLRHSRHHLPFMLDYCGSPDYLIHLPVRVITDRVHGDMLEHAGGRALVEALLLSLGLWSLNRIVPSALACVTILAADCPSPEFLAVHPILNRCSHSGGPED